MIAFVTPLGRIFSSRDLSLVYVYLGATSGSRHPPPPPGSGTRVAVLATTSSSTPVAASSSPVSLEGVSVFLSFWSDTGKEADRTVVGEGCGWRHGFDPRCGCVTYYLIINH